jgi:hypothetical protein
VSGVACAIPHLAIMGGKNIPTTASELPAFDKLLRECCAQTDIVHGLVESGVGDAVCAILRQPHFTSINRSDLYRYLDALYDD